MSGRTWLNGLSDQEAAELARLCRVALAGHDLDGDLLPTRLLEALREVRDSCVADLAARHPEPQS